MIRTTINLTDVESQMLDEITNIWGCSKNEAINRLLNKVVDLELNEMKTKTLVAKMFDEELYQQMNDILLVCLKLKKSTSFLVKLQTDRLKYKHPLYIEEVRKSVELKWSQYKDGLDLDNPYCKLIESGYGYERVPEYEIDDEENEG